MKMQSNLLASCYRAGVKWYSFVEIYSVNPAHSGTTHWTPIQVIQTLAAFPTQIGVQWAVLLTNCQLRPGWAEIDMNRLQVLGYVYRGKPAADPQNTIHAHKIRNELQQDLWQDPYQLEQALLMVCILWTCCGFSDPCVYPYWISPHKTMWSISKPSSITGCW